jgi:UDP-3-O-[3-hydroxymyristoyl] glucosamine N-acyltransferase
MMRTTRDLAEFLGAQLVGDPDRPVRGLAGPEQAGPEDLIYCESVSRLERAEESRAGTAIVPPGVTLAGKTVLQTEKPKLAFARAATVIIEPQPLARGIHPTAVIASSARLGPKVAVGPFAVIEEGVEIGEGCEISAFCFVGRGARLGGRCCLYPRVTIYPGAQLGDRVILHAGVVVGSDGFGYVRGADRQWKFPQIGRVEIAADVEIGANTTIDRGSLGVTRIQQGVKIDNLVQIAHNVEIGERTVIASQTGISGSSTVGADAMIGGQVGVGDHAVIESGAICGGQSGILDGKRIRSGQVVWGTPARPLDQFKRQFAWQSRLPELAARLARLEEKLGAK